MDTKIYQTAIEPAIRQAGDLLKQKFVNFSRTDATLKSAHEVVTQWDTESEKIIIKAIRDNFPEHEILSEEVGEAGMKSDWLWIIDPLDGTTNFTIHNPYWCVSVALVYQGQIVLGMIYAPFLSEFFVARSGEGAWLNEKPILVSSISSGKVINAFCHGYKTEDIEKAIEYFKYQKLNNFDCRQLGSAALELAYTAAGRVESIMIPGGRAWDVAAGVLLVKEAKGKVTDFEGQDWNLEMKNMLASNGLIHEQLLEILKTI
jgi:myo-inositol-1(or 4)-monophosphatase